MIGATGASSDAKAFAAAGTTEKLPGITIRSARPADNARCQQIAVAAWERIHTERRRLLGDAVYDQLFADWRPRKAAAIAQAFEQRLDCILVACETGRLSLGRGAADQTQSVGFVTFRLDRSTALGTITDNAVDPAWQGRGIATALYRRALDRFRAEGMRVASVGTGLDAGHAPACAAYRKVGFVLEVPTVTMYQQLSPPETSVRGGE